MDEPKSKKKEELTIQVIEFFNPLVLNAHYNEYYNKASNFFKMKNN